MPWEWQEPTRRRPTRSRRRYSQNRPTMRRRRVSNFRQGYSRQRSDRDDFVMDQDGMIDGFYDSRGRAVRLNIQTPTDMLPPVAQPEDWRPLRRRTRF
jgi:hypothetical protein